MKWEDIRAHYPTQWLLVEALKAHTEATERIIEDMAVIESFEDSQQALQGYANLHRAHPQRELYVLHTTRDALNIAERYRLAPRTRQICCFAVLLLCYFIPHHFSGGLYA